MTKRQTAAELSALLIKKEVSSAELTKKCLEKIAAADGGLGAFLTVCADTALKTAEKIDSARLAGGELSPLAGIPMALKDNICTAGIRTTCASRVLENFVPEYDAFAAKALGDAGCPMLGKLNMDEFGMGDTSENSAFGPVRNPIDPSKSPGGSSGGSAAAVAAGEAVFTLGSDTGGSIRQPAAFCGVVGMRPTYGRVSRRGLVAFAPSLDQIGPLTTDVGDSALVLGAISGHDPLDASCAKRPREDFYCDAKSRAALGVRGLRIGLPRELFDEKIDPWIRGAVLSAAGLLEGAGAEVAYVSLPSAGHALEAYRIISAAEASSSLARFWDTDGARAGNLGEIQNYSPAGDFGPEVRRRLSLGALALSAERRAEYYDRARRVRALVCADFDGIFKGFDLAVCPAAPTRPHGFRGNSPAPETGLGDFCTVPAGLAGLPALSMPCAFDGAGLPAGLQIIGPAFSETGICRAALVLEELLGLRGRKGDA